jgi:hypothetical protein
MHLFIVSEETLPTHLTYEFAGVHKTNDCSWSNVNVHPSAERSQASLFADVCRVHSGDEILFYLETPEHDRSREGGRFYGIFEVVSDHPFYEPRGEYLADRLGDLNLIYRLQIRPKNIYRHGLTEWHTMDEMTDFRDIYEIPWTLIYRKMTGRRGCTPLLPHEAEIIRRMLDLRNAGQQLSTNHVTFDPGTLTLQPTDVAYPYEGKMQFDRIDDWLRTLIRQGRRKWELQLQAYLMQEIGRNQELTNHLFPAVDLTWIGNEVYAGAGMQSIDILIRSRNELNTFFHLVELKSSDADEPAADQLNRYIKWLRAHIPALSVHQIVPTIIATGATQTFHSQLQTYLMGHGIVEYRVVTVDEDLHFHQEFFSGF